MRRPRHPRGRRSPRWAESLRAAGLAASLACGGAETSAPAESPDAGPPIEAPAEPAPAPTEPPAAPPPAEPEAPAPPRAGETVAIPAGTLAVGSRPGRPHRRAENEADRVPVELPAFEIDRLPYPNDPAAPPRTGLSRPEAARLCEAEGKRLCTELEWERACRGPEGDRTFAPDASLDRDACREDPLACASAEGVLQLGTLQAEWTASDGNRGLMEDQAVFRGAAPDGELPLHRCAARRATRPTTTSRHIGFRCCSGPAPEATYPTEPTVARFRMLEVELEELRRVLASVPELAPWAADFRPFDEQEMLRALPEGVESLHGWELAPGVLRWAPVDGELAWVVTGRSGEDSLVAVLHPMPDGSYVHGASFIREGESGPIALAWTPPSHGELLWSPCWGCLAEGGAVVLREEDRRIVVVQR